MRRWGGKKETNFSQKAKQEVKEPGRNEGRDTTIHLSEEKKKVLIRVEKEYWAQGAQKEKEAPLTKKGKINRGRITATFKGTGKELPKKNAITSQPPNK